MSGPPGSHWQEGSPERLYVITGGRGGQAGRTDLGLVTLIVSRTEPTAGMQPECAAILRICRSPLSVAEVSAYLELPFSVVAVLLADLLTEGKVEARAPAAARPHIAVIEAVIDGLQKL